jgi:hypothetical protein
MTVGCWLKSRHQVWGRERKRERELLSNFTEFCLYIAEKQVYAIGNAMVVHVRLMANTHILKHKPCTYHVFYNVPKNSIIRAVLTGKPNFDVLFLWHGWLTLQGNARRSQQLQSFNLPPCILSSWMTRDSCLYEYSLQQIGSTLLYDSIYQRVWLATMTVNVIVAACLFIRHTTAATGVTTKSVIITSLSMLVLITQLLRGAELLS